MPNIPRDVYSLSEHLDLPQLPELLSRFLYRQTHPDINIAHEDVPLAQCPPISGRVRVFPSAVATFFAPSDKSGIGGMYRERIRAVRSWRKGPARYDCAFVEPGTDLPGFRGLQVARVLLFFSVDHERIKYPCALVTWFSPVSDEPCPDTGMWIVEPDVNRAGTRLMEVIHLDTLLRSAHLIGVSGEDQLPRRFRHYDTLDSFKQFYVNKYADHQAHEIAF